MKTLPHFLAALLAVFAANSMNASQPLPRNAPETQGVSSPAILAFVQAAEKEIDALHSFMLVRHGFVVAEGWWAPYGPDSPHELASLSKSFTSTAVGIAIAEGKLSLYDKVLPFFPEFAPADPSENLKAMRVHDLLIMSCGQTEEALIWGWPGSWKKRFLAQPVPYTPGRHFLYNSAGTYMLSAIVQQATGSTVLDYLKPRLFTPLGIDHPIWETSPEGVTTGGWGLSLCTEDIAKFGQLLLQKGEWHGKQLVPAAWVVEATSKQTSSGGNPDSDWDQGYGYQFWRCKPGFYRGDGAHSQFCVVMPEQDAVLIVTAGTNHMQDVMNLLWKHFLPAMASKVPLPPNPVATSELTKKLASLALPPQSGSVTSPVAPKVSGRRYVFPGNDQNLESVVLQATGTGPVVLSVRFKGQDQTIPCTPGEWTKSRFAFGPNPERAWASSGAWISADTYAARLCAYETAYVLTIIARFEGDEVHVNAKYNVDSNAREMIGHAEPASPQGH